MEIKKAYKECGEGSFDWNGLDVVDTLGSGMCIGGNVFASIVLWLVCWEQKGKMIQSTRLKPCFHSKKKRSQYFGKKIEF